MTDVEVHIDLEGQVRPLGILHRQTSRRGETVTVEYGDAWLMDVKARILTTNIDLDEGTCSVELLQETAGYFGLGDRQSCNIIREVAEVTCTWQAVAAEVGAHVTRAPVLIAASMYVSAPPTAVPTVN